MDVQILGGGGSKIYDKTLLTIDKTIQMSERGAPGEGVENSDFSQMSCTNDPLAL